MFRIDPTPAIQKQHAHSKFVYICKNCESSKKVSLFCNNIYALIRFSSIKLGQNMKQFVIFNFKMCYEMNKLT